MPALAAVPGGHVWQPALSWRTLPAEQGTEVAVAVADADDVRVGAAVGVANALGVGGRVHEGVPDQTHDRLLPLPWRETVTGLPVKPLAHVYVNDVA